MIKFFVNIQSYYQAIMHIKTSVHVFFNRILCHLRGLNEMNPPQEKSEEKQRSFESMSMFVSSSYNKFIVCLEQPPIQFTIFAFLVTTFDLPSFYYPVFFLRKKRMEVFDGGKEGGASCRHI